MSPTVVSNSVSQVAVAEETFYSNQMTKVQGQDFHGLTCEAGTRYKSLYTTPASRNFIQHMIECAVCKGNTYSNLKDDANFEFLTVYDANDHALGAKVCLACPQGIF